MDKELDEILRNSRTYHHPFGTPYVFAETTNAKKALSIMKDYDDKKFKLLPPTNSQQQLVHEKFAQILLSLEYYKKRHPFSELFAKSIIATYKQAETLRMIDTGSDPEKEALKAENIRLRKRLEDLEKLDKPNDSLTGDVTE